MRRLCLSHFPLYVLLVILSVSGAIAGTIFSGKAIGISDGDTITVLQDKTQIKVRLHGIDAPEKHQDFGTQAKKMCADLAFGKVVSIEVIDKDRYGRTVGVVTLPDKTILNQEIVRRGMAWWYRQYAPTSKTLERLEAEARKKKVGLWSHPNPTPPWEFRNGKQDGSRKKSNPGNNSEKRAEKDPPPDSSDTVYITKTGKKYHRDGCRYLARSKIPIIGKEAEQRGYTPCKVCRP